MSAREITIDQITKLATRLAEVEYQRGYADGLNEKKATQKYWGKKPEKSCDNCNHQSDDFDEKLEHCHVCHRKDEWTPKQTDEIKVGDEVVSDAFDDKGIVTHITDDKASCVSIICSGSSMMRVGIHGLHKTGRHFPQIAEVLKQMREDKIE